MLSSAYSSTSYPDDSLERLLAILFGEDDPTAQAVAQ